MIKLTLPDNIKDSGLALPGSTPRTLVQVDGDNLPYACQCPCCGSLFNIPEGLLYKIEEDSLLDGDLGAESAEGEAQTDINIDMDDAGMGGSPAGESGTTSESEVGESSDTFI